MLQSQQSPHIELPQVFPVPATNQVTILLPDAYLNSQMQVFTATGRAVRSGVLGSSTNSIDVSDLPAGIYFISIRSHSCPPAVLKVVVQK